MLCELRGASGCQLSCAVGLQVVMDVLIIVMDEFTPAQRAWFAWRDLMNIVDIVCCCSILFPIAWRIRHLRDAAATDGKAERCALCSLVITWSCEFVRVSLASLLAPTSAVCSELALVYATKNAVQIVV